MAADRDEDDAGLLERLATARKLLQRAVAEGDVEPGIAAAACAELAGEYAARLLRGTGPGARPGAGRGGEADATARGRGAPQAGARRAGRERAGPVAGRGGLGDDRRDR